MPTKAELEKENASLERKVARLEAKPAPPAEVITREVIKEVIKEVPQGTIKPAEGMENFHFGGYVVQAPKGSMPLYSESHPINGLTKVVFQTAMAAGDGRVGDPAGQYVWRK